MLYNQGFSWCLMKGVERKGEKREGVPRPEFSTTECMANMPGHWSLPTRLRDPCRKPRTPSKRRAPVIVPERKRIGEPEKQPSNRYFEGREGSCQEIHACVSDKNSSNT